MARRARAATQVRGAHEAAETELTACVLGPVRLIKGIRDVPLTPSERLLVAALVVADRRVVTVDALAEWIWAGRSHASPRNRVQAIVSGLRRKVAPDVLVVTHEAGYRLDESVWTDLGRRADLMRLAATLPPTSSEKHALLDEAESLALGPALEGVTDSPDVDARRRRIDEESLEITLERIELALTTGQLDGLVSELGHLSEVHPFDEHVHALLMRVLVRVGRQAEALSTYRQIYTRLDDDLGVRPGPILVAAHQDVLNFDEAVTGRGVPQGRDHTDHTDHVDQAATASAPSGQPGQSAQAQHPADGSGVPRLRQVPAPRTVPRSVAQLVGRSCELEQVLEATTASSDVGHAPVVAVTGLGGMGKTTLAVEAAHRLREEFPDGTLYLHLDSETGRAGVTSVLSHFLQLLGVPPDVLPATHDAKVAMYRSILDTKRLLIVLDDIGPDVDVCDLLPARAPSAAILTSRLPLSECEPTLRIVVGALTDGESETLLGGLVGGGRAQAEPDGLRDLARACLGLPLLLRITAQRVASRPDLTLRRAASSLSREISGQAAAEQSDRAVYAVYAGLGLAEAPLSEGARQLLGRFAALPFRAASRWLLASLVGPDADGDAALDELHAAYLLETESREGLGTQFVLHDLVRLYAVQSEVQPDLTDVLGQVAKTLLATALPHAQGYPVQFLPLPAGPGGRRIGRAGSGLDPQEALEFFRTEQDTLVLCAREVAVSDPATAWRLVALLGQHALNGLELDRWFALAQAVRAHLDADRPDDRRGLAHLDLVEAHLRHETAHSRVAASLATRARRSMLLDGDLAGAIVAAVVLGRAHRANGERLAAEEALEWSARAGADDADQVDPVVRAYVALAWGSLLDDYDVLETARERLLEATRLFEGLDDWSGSATALFALARVHRRLREFTAGLPLCDVAMEHFVRLGDVNGVTAVLDTRADILVQMGEPHAALPAAAQAVEQAAVRHDDFMLHRAQRTLGRVHAALGELEQSESALRHSISGFERLDRPLSRAASLRDLGQVLQLQGRVDEASAVFVEEREALVGAGLTDTTELDAIIADLDLDPELEDDHGVA